VINKRTCLLEDMPTCGTRRHGFLLNKKTCLPVQQQDKSCHATGGQLMLVNTKTCLAVDREDVSVCPATRFVFLFNKKHVLHLSNKNMSSSCTRSRSSCAEPEDMSSCSSRRKVFMLQSGHGFLLNKSFPKQSLP